MMAELPKTVAASDSNDRVRVQKVDPTLPGIKRYQSLGAREVPAKERGPGELKDSAHRPQRHHAEEAR